MITKIAAVGYCFGDQSRFTTIKHIYSGDIFPNVNILSIHHMAREQHISPIAQLRR